MALGLQISDLSKGFVEVLFSNVNLRAAGHMKIGLIGDNGSGKSTLLRMLAGQEEIVNGRIVWTKEVNIGYLEQEIKHDTFEVSGGEKKILKLTELFYGDYNVLLLDEPDNHLDIEHKHWFEDLVKDFAGMCIIISHDRNFLENAIDTIWHLDENKVTAYAFGYTKFKEIYENNLQARQHLWESQEKERLRLREMVESLAIQAANNSKFVGRYHNAEKRLERWCEAMVVKPPKEKTIKLNFELTNDNSRKTALYLKNIFKSYGEKKVLNGLNLHLGCGQKVAIAAPNGSGKTTLLNIITGKIVPDAGELIIGPGLVMGVYTQEHLDTLDEKATMLAELQKSAAHAYFDGIAYLKKFLFTPSQIVSEVRFLSGGQKSRLQLAIFLAKKPDILVLDEPTNHLDLKTVLALENFLCDYSGTLILVSHDQILVDRVVDKVYMLKNGVLK